MTEYYEPEMVEVRQMDNGAKAFFVSAREGCLCLGQEIRMFAEHYADGTKIVVREPVSKDT